MHSLDHPARRTGKWEASDHRQELLCSHVTETSTLLPYPSTALRACSSSFTAERSRLGPQKPHHAAQDLQRNASSASPGKASQGERERTARHSTPGAPASGDAIRTKRYTLHLTAERAQRSRKRSCKHGIRQVRSNVPATRASAARAKRHSLQVAAEHNARRVVGARAPARVQSEAGPP